MKTNKFDSETMRRMMRISVRYGITISSKYGTHFKFFVVYKDLIREQVIYGITFYDKWSDIIGGPPVCGVYRLPSFLTLYEEEL